MKKLLAKLCAIALVLTMLVPGSLASASVSVNGDYTGKTVILHSNDVHGAVEKYAYMKDLKDQYTKAGAEVIVVDAGDFSQGSTYVSNYKGLSAVKMMNAVGYTYSTVGNHEFDYGYANLVSVAKKAKFDFLCANILGEDGKPIFKANDTYTTKSGVKVGFFGLNSPESQTKANPALIKGLTFLAEKDLYKCAQAQVDALADTDVVVCIAHLGVDAESAPNTSLDVYNNTKGIDLIIDGHSHTVMTEGANGEPVQSTGTAFENIGVVIIDDETKAIESRFLVACNGKQYAKKVIKKANAYINKVETLFGSTFAKSEVTLEGNRAPGNRNMETNNGDLITDAMVYQVMKNADGITVDADHIVGVTNGGGIRAAINVGDITMKDVLTVLPYTNTVTVVYITGAELLEALEASTYITKKGTTDAVGGFPQIANMKITIDTTKDFDANATTYPGSTYYGPASINRVTIDEVNGKAFSLTDTYAVITNDFCAEGGDTYYAFAAAEVKFDTGVLLSTAVVEYIQDCLGGVIGEKYAGPEGRITIK